MKNIVLGGLVAFAASFGAQAATVTGPLQTKMTVPASCRIASTTDVDFGAYTGTAVNKTMTVTARCNKNSTAGSMYIRMDCGQNGAVSGTVCTRKMKNTTPAFASSMLNYKVFTNTGYSVELPNTGSVFAGSTYATGNAFTLTLYPQLTASQYTAAYGSYSDEVSVVIAF